MKRRWTSPRPSDQAPSKKNKNMTSATKAPDPREATNTYVHNLAQTGMKSCCVIAREMIKAGADPEQHIEFIRRNTPVFSPRPLKWWAERRVRESDHNGPIRFEKYTPSSPTE